MRRTQNTLKKLDGVLSNFLRAYAVKRLDRMTTEKRLEKLRDITYSNKPQYANMDFRFQALENWFSENMSGIDRNRLNAELIQQIIDCVNQIGILCRGHADNKNEVSALFDRKRALNVANLANIFIEDITKSKPVSSIAGKIKIDKPAEQVLPSGGVPKGDDSKAKFKDSLQYQLDTLDYYSEDKYYLFSIVDQLFNSLEKKPDIKANHLAASILYFLKLNGYMVAPYVEKLRKLTRNSNG